MAFGERMPRTGFKVPLETRGLKLVGERDIGYQAPGFVLRGVYRFSSVVFRKAALQVGRDTEYRCGSGLPFSRR